MSKYHDACTCRRTKPSRAYKSVSESHGVSSDKSEVSSVTHLQNNTMRFTAVLIFFVGLVALVLGKEASTSNTCNNTLCPENQKCYMQQVQCIRAPCPPQPRCIDCICPTGEECSLEQVQCVRAPCPPLPTCKKIECSA